VFDVAYVTRNAFGQTVDEVEAIAADNPGDFPVYFGSQAGNPVGLQTVYCETAPVAGAEVIFMLRCRDWASEPLAEQQGKKSGGAALMTPGYGRSYDVKPIMPLSAGNRCGSGMSDAWNVRFFSSL
jgi:hypothetical protein